METDRTGADFAAELARLKQRGSAVLVRGDGHELGICTDLLGSEAERRLRLLLRSAESAVLPVPPDGADVIDVTTTDVRSSARHDATAFDDDVVIRRINGADGVDAVASAIVEEVERIAATGVGPGELRVCLGRLDPYLAREPIESVTDAAGRVTDAVREHAGMCHAHLGVQADESMDLVFDVTVEERTTTVGHHQHRWYLHAAGIDTGWLERGAD